MTHTTHNDEAIVDEFSTEWHRLGIPNGALPNMQDWLRQALAKARADQDRIARAEEREKTIDENTSDGYHTFRELYTFRKMYNAVLFNEWATQGVHDVHKSKKHSDGELCFGGGWFVVYATTPYGQISNHYELADWDLFKCEEREVATKFDGHTPQDVLSTLKALTTQNNNTV